MYTGNPVPNKWDKWVNLGVELTAVGTMAFIFGIQVALWIAMALVGWRLFNSDREMV